MRHPRRSRRRPTSSFSTAGWASIASPRGWAIFAAGNRQGDRGVTYVMPAPLANRFTHYELEPHLDDWVAWAYDAGIDPRVVAFLRFRPELLFDFDPAHTPVAFPSPRSWEFAHLALKKFHDIPELLGDALQACVGKAAGIELKAFVDNMERLPDIEAILRGEETDVPADIDLQYGTAAALVRRAREARDRPDAERVYGRILAYARRFPQREMGVMLVTDMHRSVGKPLFDVPEFGTWANSITDLMLYEVGALSGSGVFRESAACFRLRTKRVDHAEVKRHA